MEQFNVDCLVIGAGVVGLAIARRIALEGREVLLVDKESSIGTQTSSRNSEVIHAGIYYPKGSLKAQLCVAGKEMLYDYCAKHHLPFKACGKLIVATSDDQIARLQEIKNQAQLN
ncbi:NAD(P)/FAD-dependent oxidoreductase, partial [Oleiphilus sp. HI0061]